MSGGVPGPLSRPGDTQPVPRRIRGMLDGRWVVDTVRATYLWEHEWYPQYLLPVADLAAGLLDDPRLAGRAHDAGLPGHPGHVRIEWEALDAWYEEDEQVFVHPRSPYVRVDALRSSRSVTVELDGVRLASSTAPVLVVETGLPTRYYLDRSTIDWSLLAPSDTVSECPYKGRTTGYWSVDVGSGRQADLAWCYDFPTRQLLPIAGLVAFYNERVDLIVDGERLERPRTKFD